MNINEDFDGHDQMSFLRESLILHQFNYPSIVKFIGINFKHHAESNTLSPTIITEYLPNGSLKKYISGKNNKPPEIELTP